MSDAKAFLDTNILVYLYSTDESVKHEKVKTLIELTDNICISTQVINEFIYVMYRKRRVSYDDLAVAVEKMNGYFTISTITLNTIMKALGIAKEYQYSYFDSLIVTSALENNCHILYSEDMHHQQTISNSLKIINPFK